jgi:hypothetical protein
MSMRRLIEGLEEARSTPSFAEAAKMDGDFVVGDTKGRTYSRGRYRYVRGDGVDGLGTQAAQYLLSRLSNESGQILNKDKFIAEFVYGANTLIEDNLDDIVEKALKASNGGKTSPL